MTANELAGPTGSRLPSRRPRQRRMRNRAITYGIVGAVVLAGVVLIFLLMDNGDSSSDSAADTFTDLDYPETGGRETSADDGDYPTTGDADTEPTTDLDGEFVYGTGDCPPADGAAEPRLEFTEPQPLCIDPDRDHVAVFDTSEGEIRVELDTGSVPGTVNNFATLARWGYYDDTLLFRTDPSIAIIQGGSPHTNSASDPGPGYTIRDEPAFEVGPDGTPIGPYRYRPGQLVMARSFGINSASAQFFFTTGDEAALLDGQGTYVVFGSTDDAGLEILRSIIDLHVPGGSLGGAPSRDVTISSVTIEEV